MQTTDIFGHIKHSQVYEVDFNDRFEFSLNSLSLVKRFFTKQYDRKLAVFLTKEQWNIISEEKYGDMSSRVLDMDILSKNSDKCYFIVR